LTDPLNDLLAELARDAAEVEEYDPKAEAARQRIRDKLPQARALGAGPAELERAIRGIYTAKSISRWTDESAPGDQRRGRRKRNGAPVAA